MKTSIYYSEAFSIPCTFEVLYGARYSPTEKYLYVVFRQLSQSLANEDGWFLYRDRPQMGEDGLEPGLRSHGFSDRAAKSGRKKLIADGLLETKYDYGCKGYRKGTWYRLRDDKLIFRRQKIEIGR